MIELKNISKNYQAKCGDRVAAVKNLDLKIEAGQFTALCGPSGCGKSTLLLIAGTMLEPDSKVETALDFGDQGTATATFDLEPEGSETKVTWGFSTDLGFNPVARYFGLMFDSWIGADYEAGLANLKALVEDA